MPVPVPMPPDGVRPDPDGPSGELAASEPDAIDVLEADHRRLEELFDRYDHAGPADRATMARAVCAALELHARIEEELFYPVAREATGAMDLLAEAQIEHAAARALIVRIEAGDANQTVINALVRVLGEYASHHMIEEEDELFPLCREAGIDLVAMARALTKRRQQLVCELMRAHPELAGLIPDVP